MANLQELAREMSGNLPTVSLALDEPVAWQQGIIDSVASLSHDNDIGLEVTLVLGIIANAHSDDDLRRVIRELYSGSRVARAILNGLQVELDSRETRGQ
jgi:hypothetical protein